MRRYSLILVTIALLSLFGNKPSALAGLHITFTGKEGAVNITGWSMGLAALSAAGYYMYKNSPAQRAKGYQEELGPGEWYLGGYSGLSYLPPADWKATVQESVGPGAIPLKGLTAKNITYQPGVQVGLKFGRFFDSLPWFGIEGETNFSRNNIRGNQGAISPPPPTGPINLFGGSDWFEIWTMQLSLLARYGFLKDKEVNFGRLQPYVGIGPGWEVIYATHDSAKNFAFEALAGVKYMFTEKIGLFLEYKFSYQLAAEYQDMPVGKNPLATSTWAIDVPHHRFILGVSYHFKNLYGN